MNAILPTLPRPYDQTTSTRAHVSDREDGITALAPIRARVPRFADLLAGGADAEAFARLRAAESVGRPLGDDDFLARIERLTARTLKAEAEGKGLSAV